MLQVKVKDAASAGGWDVVSSWTYNSQHQPLSTTDAAGQTTTYTYNAAGQPLTVVAPPHDGLAVAQRTTTYSYDAQGVLQSVSGPASGLTTTYTYDSFNRVRTATDPDGYTLTYDYDTFDRAIRTTYLDGTFEETQYDRLDAARRRDRLGRWTHTFHDPLRRVTATRDPADRMVTQVWCACGSVEKVVDANGNATRWERDVQGRTIKEIRADGSFKSTFYETTTSRVKTTIDAKLQEIQYAYGLDDKPLSTTYVNAQHPTPDVVLSYVDPVTAAPDAHGRLRKMIDGTGATVYAYHLLGGLGAGQLAFVDGPLANDTVSYGYDELGRLSSRTLNGVNATWHYDQLGRLQTQSDPTGTFSYTYDGVTGRVATMTYPNAQTSTYTYFGNEGEHRLQEIHHRKPDASTLSRFGYAYDAVGNIKAWTQQTDVNPAKTYEFEHDPADQLIAAVFKQETPPSILRRYYYAYDPAGNRTAEQIDDGVTGASYDRMNRLVRQQAGGALRIQGTVTEPANVTVAGRPASGAGSTAFGASTAVVPGGTMEVKATDPSGNVRTNVYEIGQAVTPTNFTYDLDGNLSSDGSRTYEWDGQNRLLAVKQGGNTVANFTYDAEGRRTSKTAGGVTTTYVYDGAQFLEERSSVRNSRYVYGQGIDDVLARQDSGSAFYYVKDHLGSVRQITNAAGAAMVTRDYDPWGNPSAGSTEPSFAFTGRELDPETSLYYYRARYYDDAQGRFLSEDPAGGTNLFEYAMNSPVSFVDPSGLSACPANVVKYIQSIAIAAKSAAGPDCPCSVMIIHSGHETGWGQAAKLMRLNNYFGMWGEGDAGSEAAARDPKVKLARFSSPQACFGSYCKRSMGAGIRYSSDSQYIKAVVNRFGYSAGNATTPTTQPQYIAGILSHLNRCKKELDECCK